MSGDDFFVTSPGPTRTAAPEPPPPRPRRRRSRWPVGVAVVAVVGLVVALVAFVALRGSGPGRPDPATARLFGQQTRAQLPPPVTEDECRSALHAFPAVDGDARARAQFLAGCTRPTG